MTDFEAAWRKASPWLAAALAHAGDTHTLDDVRAMVEAREARFWSGRDAAMVTTLEEHPRFKALMIWLAGGDLAELVHEIRPAAERWAAAEGCTRSMVLGRPGWARVLASEGYGAAATLLTKDLGT